MHSFPHSDALCASTAAYCPGSVAPGLFDRAMVEITRFHIEQTPGYEHWLNANGVEAKDLETFDDWSHLPPIFANFFKQHLRNFWTLNHHSAYLSLLLK